MSINPAIILPAFRRPHSFARLLKSFENAYLPEDSNIPVIISLDGGYDADILELAKQFIAGKNAEIIEREKNLGLRDHILWCGNLTKKYGAIILLEEDLLVDPYFYHYSRCALHHCDTDPRIAGVALYSPSINEYIGAPFEAVYNGASGYLMKIPCSWGQAWTDKQWAPFFDWYESSGAHLSPVHADLHCAVKKWPDSSWKKHFASYLVTNNLYFLYPYRSFTTNCSDPGGFHHLKGTLELHASLQLPEREDASAQRYSFPNSNAVYYDQFFELHADMVKHLFPSLSTSELEIDLYASKPISLLQRKKYVITTRNVSQKIQPLPLVYKPLPLNMWYRSESTASNFAVLAESKNLVEESEVALDLKRAELLSNIDVKRLRKIYRAEILDTIRSSPGGGVFWLTYRLVKKYRELIKKNSQRSALGNGK